MSVTTRRWNVSPVWGGRWRWNATAGGKKRDGFAATRKDAKDAVDQAFDDMETA